MGQLLASERVLARMVRLRRSRAQLSGKVSRYSPHAPRTETWHESEGMLSSLWFTDSEPEPDSQLHRILHRLAASGAYWALLLAPRWVERCC